MNSCLEHVTHPANTAVMGKITKISIIDTTNAIWEFNSSLSRNRILGNDRELLLDVIAALHTLIIKVCSIQFIQLYSYSILFLLDPHFRTANWILWKARNWMWLPSYPQAHTPEQHMMGECIWYVGACTSFAPGTSIFIFWTQYHLMPPISSPSTSSYHPQMNSMALLPQSEVKDG